MSFAARQVCRPSSPLPSECHFSRSAVSQARKPVDLQSGSHVFAVHGWMDSTDEFQPDLAAQITPCFHKVFEPHRKRGCFLPRVTRRGEELPPARTLSAASIVTLLAKQWRKCKRKCDCKDLICYTTLIRDKDFLRKLAHWRRGWIMSTRKDPIALLGRAKFLCFAPSEHFSWAPRFLSCRPSWSAL